MAQYQLGILMGLTASIGLSAGCKKVRQEQSDRSSSAWRWQPFMDHVMGKGWRQWETPLPCHDLTLEKSSEKHKTAFSFLKSSCHIHSKCRMGTWSILEMQIQEHLHLRPLGVTKSLGWLAALPLLWGLGTGLWASLWQFQKWVGSKRGRLCLGGGVISSHWTKYGGTPLCSFCPSRLYRTDEKWQHKLRGNGAHICWFDYYPPALPWLYHGADHRGDSKSSCSSYNANFFPSKPSSSNVHCSQWKPSELCAHHKDLQPGGIFNLPLLFPVWVTEQITSSSVGWINFRVDIRLNTCNAVGICFHSAPAFQQKFCNWKQLNTTHAAQSTHTTQCKSHNFHNPPITMQIKKSTVSLVSLFSNVGVYPRSLATLLTFKSSFKWSWWLLIIILSHKLSSWSSATMCRIHQ